MNTQAALLKILRSRFIEMQTRNPSYSVRAYARKLGMGVSTLSMVMNGHRRASPRMAARIADRLLLDPIERAAVVPAPGSTGAKKEPLLHVVQFLKVSADQHQAFSEWHYVAILNLVRLRSFHNDSEWIGSRLGISSKKAADAVERLKRLGLLVEDAKGQLKRTQEAYRTTDDVADVSVRKSHFQTLELAQKSLQDDPIDVRDFTWLTLAVDRSRMKEMKAMIRKFQTEFTELFGKDAGADEIYRIGVQLFPLTRPEGAKKTQEKKQ